MFFIECRWMAHYHYSLSTLLLQKTYLYTFSIYVGILSRYQTFFAQPYQLKIVA